MTPCVARPTALIAQESRTHPSVPLRVCVSEHHAGPDGDPGPRIAALSTYLGHVDPGKTYWYLQAAPELMHLAGQRLQRHLGGGR